MTPHVGGIHLAQIRMAQRMASKLGDDDFVRRCDKWLDDGSKLPEEKLSTGSYYLSAYEPETGKKSDWIFSAQLDGEWTLRFHGMAGAFLGARVETTLDTILRNCVPHTAYGVVNFTQNDGSLTPRPGYMSYGMFFPEVYIFAMLLIYTGRRKEGLKIARNCAFNLTLNHRCSWTQANVIRGDRGENLRQRPLSEHGALGITCSHPEHGYWGSVCARGLDRPGDSGGPVYLIRDSLNSGARVTGVSVERSSVRFPPLPVRVRNQEGSSNGRVPPEVTDYRWQRTKAQEYLFPT
jgi:hypothetical protein